MARLKSLASAKRHAHHKEKGGNEVDVHAVQLTCIANNEQIDLVIRLFWGVETLFFSLSFSIQVGSGPSRAFAPSFFSLPALSGPACVCVYAYAYAACI